MDHIEKLLTALQKSLPLTGSLAVSTGVVLLGPPRLLVALGLHAMDPALRTKVGLVFVASAALTSMLFAARGLVALAQWRKARKVRKWQDRALEELTTNERRHLAALVYEQQQTRCVYGEPDGVVRSLVLRGIVTVRSDYGGGYWLIISRWAWERFVDDPDLVLGDPDLIPGSVAFDQNDGLAQVG